LKCSSGNPIPDRAIKGKSQKELKDTFERLIDFPSKISKLAYFQFS